MNFVDRYCNGFNFFIQGTKLIFKVPGLKAWALIPFIINLFLLFVGFAFGFEYLSLWVTSAIGLLLPMTEGFWFFLIYYPLLILFWIGFIVLLMYGVYFVASIVASPFNSFLAEKTLAHFGLIEEKPFSLGGWISVTGRMILVSVGRAVILGFVGLFLFLFSFVPILNLAASFFAFMIISFDCMDYSFEVKQYGFQERFNFFLKNKIEFMGMGTFIGMTLLLPGILFLLLPSGVVGAAWVLKEIEGRKNDTELISQTNFKKQR